MALPSAPFRYMQIFTYEAKNVPNGGDTDDQGVGAGQQDYSDDGVADPAEVLRGTQELVYRGTNLQRERERQKEVILHEQLHSCDSNDPRSVSLTLTGKSTTGTVRVTAVSTARRTINRTTSDL